MRRFFESKGFDEVETAILQAQAGGAMARTFSTHHNDLDHDFVLRISLELDLKRTIGGGFSRVFEIGKNFRNEGTDPSHLQEFTMCEWYAAFADLDTNKKWTEEMFHHIVEKCLPSRVVQVMNKNGDMVDVDLGAKFDEKRFPELLMEHAGVDMFHDSMEKLQKIAKEVGVEKITGVGRANLLDDIYKKTARAKLIQPTFVFDYPEDLKPLARPNGDGTACCYQLVINGWEVVNSYGELINPIVQRELFEVQSRAKAGGDEEAMEVDEVFLKAMEHGFPPMTGSGFGIDRLITLFTGQGNLRDTVLFPTMRPINQDSSHN
jgi:lysyl-tRNA synthetase class 2